jgi:hypothetical protein
VQLGVPKFIDSDHREGSTEATAKQRRRIQAAIVTIRRQSFGNADDANSTPDFDHAISYKTAGPDAGTQKIFPTPKNMARS